MKLVRALTLVSREPRRRVVTIGNFDGVHLAHQAICRRVTERADAAGAESAAVSFHPHPAAVLAAARAPRLLVGIRDRVVLLAQTGIELIVVQRFTPALARIEPEAFVDTYLVDRLGAMHVVIGHNFRFGHHRRGDEDLLRRLGAARGFTVEAVGPIVKEGIVVSSTAIREAIAAGDLARAGLLLGRPHFVSGRVVHGEHRGAMLGFPTANLRLSAGLLPPNGVYAVRVDAGGPAYGGIANLGTTPTFGPGAEKLEAHLFDFSGDLYGRRLRLSFVRRLRSEAKFSGPEALAAQIRRDVVAAREALDES